MKKKYIYIMLTLSFLGLGYLVQTIGNYLYEIREEQIFKDNKELLDKAASAKIFGHENTDTPSPIYSDIDQAIINEAEEILNPLKEMAQKFKYMYAVLYVLSIIFAIKIVDEIRENRKNRKSI
ncbi:hypothetical protein CHH83_02495 [Bacillus sp. 7586-K]|nr:hypothetical protein CHH83_02495 [Bacillus sp. 7586-K]